VTSQRRISFINRRERERETVLSSTEDTTRARRVGLEEKIMEGLSLSSPKKEKSRDGTSEKADEARDEEKMTTTTKEDTKSLGDERTRATEKGGSTTTTTTTTRKKSNDEGKTVTKPPSPAGQMDRTDEIIAMARSPRRNVERNVSGTSKTTTIDSFITAEEEEEEEEEKDVDLPYDRTDSVAFFDLDHTVVDTNSSWLWVQHEVNSGRVGAHMILTAIYWFGRYALGYGAGAERAGAEAAETYKGVHSDKLRGDVETFFNEEMKHRIRPGCVPVLRAHKRRSQRVIMCTSTWQHPAETAAKMFGFETKADDVICSHMQVDEEGVLNGKLTKIAYGDEKYERTKEWAMKNNVDLKKCYFYTDSYSDVKLMENVGYPVAVNPDPRLLKHAESRGWEIVDWGLAPQRAKKPRYHYGCLNGARQSYA